jgi:peptide/nickel transport system ATP-binding protein
MSLLEVSGLTISYPEGAAPVVEDLSFAVDRGETVGLVGESGSGKSQTALALMGLLPPHALVEGSVRFDGSELLGAKIGVLNRYRARRLAVVFQDPQQALNPVLRIGDQLKYVLLEHRMVPQAAVAERTLRLLHQAGLPDPERQSASFPHQLSGGMRQRAMIALALACDPELLIADEPTTALDVTVQAQILALLRSLRESTGIALLLITHDLGVIAENCRRMLVLDGGRLVEGGPTADVFRHPSHAVTRSLLAVAPAMHSIESPRPGAVRDEEPVLRIDNLSVSFEAGRRAWRARRRLAAVSDVSLALHAGETVAIVGESGSGKTTVARAVLGLVAPEAGALSLRGARLPAEVRARNHDERRSVQMVFQDPSASLDPAMRISAIIGEALAVHEPQLDRPERRRRAAAVLERVGLAEELLERYPHELSGGQAQRVAIARALVPGPRVLVCDEAVAALDGRVRQGVLELLMAEQRASGLSLLFITHDLAVVRRIAHRVLVMYMGRTCEIADVEALFTRPRHPYTRVLIDSLPVAEPGRRPRAAAASGEIAAFADAPGGCAFHPRCTWALGRCRDEVPRPETLGGAVAACHRARELDLRAERAEEG